MDPIPAMKIVARIQSEFPQKFGIPRQSGLVEELKAAIVFEPEYRIPQALRGLEEFSHIWLIWLFSEAAQSGWSPTVRPPRLGGNTRMGVFATRSPFRPNPIGLSAVRLDGVRQDEKLGPVLLVSGADLTTIWYTPRNRHSNTSGNSSPQRPSPRRPSENSRK